MVPHLWVMLHTSAECKIYSNSRAHGIERVTVWSHNYHFFWDWLGWRECFGKSVRQLCRERLRMRSPSIPSPARAIYRSASSCSRSLALWPRRRRAHLAGIWPASLLTTRRPWLQGLDCFNLILLRVLLAKSPELFSFKLVNFENT